jgi:predicted pyridoxine 5'-phosphate oxidase superfamily flavin-nucleotide-binding protein
MTAPTSDVAFSPSVKAAQTAHGSRDIYARQEARGGFRTGVTPELQTFLAGVDTAYLATASAAGQPYAQHRGGPPGFIRALGPDLLGFADYAGNRQYISTGNLAENDRAFLFLMDYARARRIKLWGRAHMTDDEGMIARLMPEGYGAQPEQALLFTVAAWDTNCSQHIPRKLNVSDVMAVLQDRDDRIKKLEADLAELRKVLSSQPIQEDASWIPP